MPSGGNTPVDFDAMRPVWNDYKAAVEHGLVFEWLSYFIGGLVNEKLPVEEASHAA